MKISLNNIADKISFNNVCIGNVFKFCGEYFMRIENVYNDCTIIANAVRLTNGTHHIFSTDEDEVETVILVNAELYVNN